MYYVFKTIAIFLIGLATLLTGSPGKSTVKMIAHSGYCTKYLENTEPAFIGAVKNGSNGIETDVRFTKDGVPITWHDGTVEFTDGTVVNVHQYTLEELQKKPIKNWINDDVVYICTLERYYEICKQYKMYCFLDLKDDFSKEDVKKILDLGERVYDINMIIPQSSSVQNLVNIREQYPNLKLMLTYGRLQFERGVDYRVCFKYNFSIDADYKTVSKDMVKEFHDRGLEFGIWTCNTPFALNYGYALGVDYMETDK